MNWSELRDDVVKDEHLLLAAKNIETQSLVFRAAIERNEDFGTIANIVEGMNLNLMVIKSGLSVKFLNAVKDGKTE